MTDGQSELARENSEYMLLVRTVLLTFRGPLANLRDKADYYERLGYETELIEEAR